MSLFKFDDESLSNSPPPQSQILSQIILDHLDNKEPTQKDLFTYEKNARKQYNQLIVCDDWKEVLTATASLLAKKQQPKTGKTNNKNNKTPFQIGHGHSIETITQQIITVGRYNKNDIIVKRQTASRLHNIIFILDNKVIIVDLASLLGTKTIARSSGKMLEHSEPKNRKVLEFDWGESVILELGGETNIVLFPKICVVCMVGPRTIKLNCGHYILCLKCYRMKNLYQNKCPQCRGKIESQFVEKDVYALDTFGVSTPLDTFGVYSPEKK